MPKMTMMMTPPDAPSVQPVFPGSGGLFTSMNGNRQFLSRPGNTIPGGYFSYRRAVANSYIIGAGTSDVEIAGALS